MADITPEDFIKQSIKFFQEENLEERFPDHFMSYMATLIGAPALELMNEADIVLPLFDYVTAVKKRVSQEKLYEIFARLILSRLYHERAKDGDIELHEDVMESLRNTFTHLMTVWPADQLYQEQIWKMQQKHCKGCDTEC